MALLAIELDHFLHVIEETGPGFGDRLLRGAAERLRGVLRRTDTVARLPRAAGFAALVEGLTRPEDAGVVVAKLLRSLSRPFYLDGHEIHLTASVGFVAPAEDKAGGLAAALKDAEDAMAAAAGAGGGRPYPAGAAAVCQSGAGSGSRGGPAGLPPSPPRKPWPRR